MKKSFIFALLLICVICIAGCSSNSIIGKWSHGSFTYTFNKDNTCSYDISGTKMECTYKVDGDKLSILFKDNTVPFETTYKIEKNVLHITDSFGEDVTYDRK